MAILEGTTEYSLDTTLDFPVSLLHSSRVFLFCLFVFMIMASPSSLQNYFILLIGPGF